MGVWNGWGYGLACFQASNFQISEFEIWRKSLFLRNSRHFLEISASVNFRALENGHSIRHQSIPPLSAGRFMLHRWSRKHFKLEAKMSTDIFWPLTQRAEHGALDPWSLNLRFLGRPDFQSRGPKTLILMGFGAIRGKNLGRPKRRSNDHGSNAPCSGLLTNF